VPERSRLDENAVLMAATRLTDGPVPSPGTPLDWDYLRRAADCQGVTALVHHWLQRHPDVAVEPAVRDAWHEAYWQGHFRNRLLFEELDRIAALASAEGIRLMPLKGAYLAPRVYPAPALRPLSDLDLLTVPDDVARFGALLAREGYREVDHAPSYVEDRFLDIDSRDYAWFAVRQGFDALIEYRVAPLELAVGRLTDLDPAYTEVLRGHARQVWARASQPATGGLYEESPEDVLLHVTTHMAAKHVHFRLIWLCDVAQLVARTPAFDWEYVARRSADLRMAAPVAAALEASRRHAGAAVTDDQLGTIVRTLGPRSRWSLEHRDFDRLVAHARDLPAQDLSVDGPRIWPIGAALSRVRGWRARLRVLRWVMLPGREYLAHRGTNAPGALGRVAGSLKRLAIRVTAARR